VAERHRLRRAGGAWFRLRRDEPEIRLREARAHGCRCLPFPWGRFLGELVLVTPDGRGLVEARDRMGNELGLELAGETRVLPRSLEDTCSLLRSRLD
jgi:hypothetical protein